GGEDGHDRLLAEDFGEVDLVHLVGRHPGVDLCQVVADVGGGQRGDLRRSFADFRHLGEFADDGGGEAGGGGLAVLALDHRPGEVGAVGGEVDLWHDVD